MSRRVLANASRRATTTAAGAAQHGDTRPQLFPGRFQPLTLIHRPLGTDAGTLQPSIASVLATFIAGDVSQISAPRDTADSADTAFSVRRLNQGSVSSVRSVTVVGKRVESVSPPTHSRPPTSSDWVSHAEPFAAAWTRFPKPILFNQGPGAASWISLAVFRSGSRTTRCRGLT
jgi:hypothetical protein